MTHLERLQLRGSTLDDELCRCLDITPLHLRYAFSEFPFFCVECTGQVVPSSLEISEDLAKRILEWCTVYSALFDLWLDSAAYETFAKDALSDPLGQVNEDGLKLAAIINKQRGIFYWWFFEDNKNPVEHCPLCHGEMIKHHHRVFRFCNKCQISC